LTWIITSQYNPCQYRYCTSGYRERVSVSIEEWTTKQEISQILNWSGDDERDLGS
jgi:hypothetical protein